MALIKCPECNKEVSDKAEICVHCGYPISKWIKEKNSDSSQSNEDIKDDNPNNIYLYREKEYNLTELVDYIKENTHPDVEINSQTWAEARHILRTYISIGKEEDLLISYIHKYRMLGTTKDRKKYYEHKKTHVSHTQFNYAPAYSNKNNMYNPYCICKRDTYRVGSSRAYNSNREVKARHKIMQYSVRIWKCNANRIRRVKL